MGEAAHGHGGAAEERFHVAPRSLVSNLAILPPQLLKPHRISGCVPDGVLNAAVSEIILNEPGISSLVGQGEAARMVRHVGMGIEGQGCGYLVPPRSSRKRFLKIISAGERGLASSQRSKSWTRTVCSVSGCFTLTEISI